MTAVLDGSHLQGRGAASGEGSLRRSPCELLSPRWHSRSEQTDGLRVPSAHGCGELASPLRRGAQRWPSHPAPACPSWTWLTGPSG